MANSINQANNNTINSTFTIIDIETTGLSKHRDKITEIAAARIENGQITEYFQTLINPKTEIPRFITNLTGIDNELVKNAPTIDQVLPNFVDFLGEDIFVAHNATFDFGFLEHNCLKHHNHKLTNKKLCTRKLANRLFPNLPRKRLADLCEHLEIHNEQAHRAMGDVKATVGVFHAMLDKLHSYQIQDLHSIINFERSPRIKRSNH
jgi:DNA polymerase III subunit alpha, Gram-positive type